MNSCDQGCEANIVAVAVDAGPVNVMRSLAFPGIRLVHEVSSIDGCDLLLVGTSGSDVGRLVEQKMRRFAVCHGVPLIIIEDFPGNYRHVDGGVPDLLLVEHQFSASLHQQRLGEMCPEIATFPNPRYDSYRCEGPVVAEMLTQQRAASGGSMSILWAGQPETDDALLTLKRLSPEIKDLHLRVLLKAHPRDEGYRNGVYKDFFVTHGIDYIDVTTLSLRDCCFEYVPRLVVTQFSSLAIEAGFLSLPSLYVLYPDVGAKRLMTDKGYKAPPWCDCGAALLIDGVQQQRKKLEMALTDESLRNSIIDNFYAFWGRGCSASEVRACIMGFADKSVDACGTRNSAINGSD